jgi:cytochrome P450
MVLFSFTNSFSRLTECVGTEPIIIADHDQHTRVRRLFSPAFSDRALRKQELLFKKHADLMISKLRQACAAGETVDMVRIFNFTTFDTMSDMCFGKTLGLLENNEYSPWVKAVFQSVKIIPFIQIIEYYPALKLLYNLLEPKALSDLKTNHFKHSADLVDERLARGSDQPDIWNLVTPTESSSDGLTLNEMHSNADFFMVAGTETLGKTGRPQESINA